MIAWSWVLELGAIGSGDLGIEKYPGESMENAVVKLETSWSPILLTEAWIEMLSPMTMLDGTERSVTVKSARPLTDDDANELAILSIIASVSRTRMG